ncbi:MAG: M12 family metallo-peptidase [Candidatus Kapaibacterium sp.]
MTRSNCSHRLLLILLALAAMLRGGDVFANPVISGGVATFSASNVITGLPGTPIVPTASVYSVKLGMLHEKLSAIGRVEITDFPISTTEVATLDLKRGRSPIDASTQCLLGTVEGERKITAPEIIVYRGKILGEPNSKITFILTPSFLLCAIERKGMPTFIFGPNNLARGPEVNIEHLLIAETDLLGYADKFPPFRCFNDAIAQPIRPTPISELLPHTEGYARGGVKGTTGLLQLDIAVEIDNVFYKAIASDTMKVLGYVGAMFAMSSAIYEDEANITFHLPWVKIWTTADPYNVNGNAYALPDTVKRYWLSHYQNVQRDVAHVMTSVGYGGGGFGWFGLCDPNWSYAVSSPQTGNLFPTFAFTYDSWIVAHETGHNFSLPHSHDCYWNPPLDTCYTKDDPNLSIGDACDSLPIKPRKSPGTIMSYCARANYTLSGNNFSEFKSEMTFSHRVDTVLRANAQLAACVKQPSVPTIIVLAPRGGDTLHGASVYPIEWTYANITKVGLQFSSDGGTKWQPIADKIDAPLGTYAWSVPNLSSTKLLVRAIDQSDSDSRAADTSLFFSTILFTQAVKTPLAKSAATVSIIPNPAREQISLSSSTDLGYVTCEILDVLGKVCTTLRSDLTVTAPLHFDLKELPNGRYFLRISPDGASAPIKVLPFVHQE